MGHELLLEIGTEEIPAGFILPGLDNLKKLLAAKLHEAGLSHGDIVTAGAPRRLTVAVNDLADCQPDQKLEFAEASALVEEAVEAIRWRRATLPLCGSDRTGSGVVYERTVAAPDHPGWERARNLGGRPDHRRFARDGDGVISGR